MIYRLCRKTFTGNGVHSGYSRTTNNFDYAETDDLKRMKDSEILQEDEVRKPGYGKVTNGAAHSAIIGGMVGGSLGLANLARKWDKLDEAARSTHLKKAGKWAALGAGAAAIYGAYKGSQERQKDVDRAEKYNNRLRYAQRKAARRERSDFKANMSQRDGYSY